MRAVLLTSIVLAGLNSVSAWPQLFSSKAWVKSLTIDGLLVHSRALQSFADANGGHRAFGSGGYNASADYVYNLAKKAGYRVYRQTVPYPRFIFFEGGLSIDNVEFASNQWAPFQYSPPTPADGVTAPLVFVPDREGGAEGAGCDVADYEGLDVTGKIAFVSRGICTFELKSNLAKDAGAAALIVYNNVPGGGVVSSRIGTDPDRSVPSVIISLEDALPYISRLNGTSPEEIPAFVFVDSIVEIGYSDNVIAQSRWGNQNNVIHIGAHLDSVPAGPGINDDGSGTALVAELALTLSKFIPPVSLPWSKKKPNAVRFSWWTTEEVGLVGSRYYVEHLSEQERGKIAAYINNDMVASPNYIYGIYDGDNSAGGNNRPPSPGDAILESLFQADYDAHGIPHTAYGFTGSSDYDPFLEVGIPSGGVATGAGGLKTEAQVAIFGGIVGEQYDQCYHQACDTIDNLAHDAFIVNTHAAARIVAKLIDSTEVLEQAAGTEVSAKLVGDASSGVFDRKGCDEHVEL